MEISRQRWRPVVLEKERNISVKLMTGWQDPESCRHCPERFFPLGTFQGCSFTGAPTTSNKPFLAAGIELQSARGSFPKEISTGLFFLFSSSYLST